MRDLDPYPRARAVLSHAILVLGSLAVAFPFVWMLATSVKGPSEVLRASQLLPRIKHYHEFVDLLGDTVEARVEIEGGADPASLPPTTPIQVKYLTGIRKGEREATTAGRITSRRFLWRNYRTAWNALEPSFTVYFWNSALVAGLTTLGVLVTSSLAAYAFVFFRFPGRDLVFSTLLVTMMVPQQVLLIPDFLILRQLGWYDTYAALIVPFTAGAFGIFLLRQFFMAIPRDLFEAATIDGCSRFGFFWRILLPLSGPPLVTLALFTFLASWNALLWPLVVTDDPSMRVVQVALNVFQQAEGTSWELLMAASTLTILPLVFGYFLAQRQFVQSIAGTGLKG